MRARRRHHVHRRRNPSSSTLLILGGAGVGLWLLTRQTAAKPVAKPWQGAPQPGYQYMNGRLAPITGYVADCSRGPC